MRRAFLLCLLTVSLAAVCLHAQSASEQVQVGPPPMRHAEAPQTSSSSEDLEKQGDDFRFEKAYLDALDYYHAAIEKTPNRPQLYNKAGICELQLRRYPQAKKNFEQAIKKDKLYADAYNNLGVIYYMDKNYGKAIKLYKKALQIRQDSASYYSNLGAAYFSKKQFENANQSYEQALQIDPDIFERTSHSGVTAQMPSPEDRAHFDYVLAKLYARVGNTDRSLQCLRRAMEEGYKGIEEVYKDNEFAGLRKDPRFTELMAARPPAIPE